MSSPAGHPHLPKRLIPGLISIWLLIFVLGVIGHLNAKNSLSDSIFKALQLFHLHYHPAPESAHAAAGSGSEPPSEGSRSGEHSKETLPDSSSESGWALQIARFGGALWGLALIPLAVSFLFEQRIHRWYAGRFWTGHYVVCGTSSRSITLVRDLRKAGHRVALVGAVGEHDQAFPSGVLHLDGDSGDCSVLRNAAVHRAAYMVALHPDDRNNVETLVAAGEVCRARGKKVPPLNAYIHIGDRHLERMLREMIEHGPGVAGSAVREHLLNYHELMARILARTLPLPPSISADRPRVEHLIILGFAGLGQQVASKLIRVCQQLYRDVNDGQENWQVAKPKITVVDPNAEELIAEFRLQNPGASECCEFSVCAVPFGTSKFLSEPCVASSGPNERKTLFYCVEGEAASLRALSLIEDLASASPCRIDRIFVRMARPERLGLLLSRLTTKRPRPVVSFFASDAEVFNTDVLLNQQLDLLAKEIHTAWSNVEAADRRANNLPTATGKGWDELSEGDRQANREAADHLWAKLHLLGYSLQEVPPENPAQLVDQQLLREIHDREEELAEAEHYRWMTWRVLNGWRRGVLRDNEQKLHPDIGAYNALGETTKEKDRANVRIIPRLLKQGRLSAHRFESDSK